MNSDSLYQSQAEEFCRKRRFADPIFVGKGAFKETFRTQCGTETFALKILEPSKVDLSRSEREIAAMKKCDHPNIAKLVEFGCFDSSVGSIFFFLEEFLDGGSLADRLGNTPQPTEAIRKMGLVLTMALDHLRELTHQSAA